MRVIASEDEWYGVFLHKVPDPHPLLKSPARAITDVPDELAIRYFQAEAEFEQVLREVRTYLKENEQ